MVRASQGALERVARRSVRRRGAADQRDLANVLIIIIITREAVRRQAPAPIWIGPIIHSPRVLRCAISMAWSMRLIADVEQVRLTPPAWRCCSSRGRHATTGRVFAFTQPSAPGHPLLAAQPRRVACALACCSPMPIIGGFVAARLGLSTVGGRHGSAPSSPGGHASGYAVRGPRPS